jgi:hypothetical protein
MSDSIFLDTGAILALALPGDKYHAPVVDAIAGLSDASIITTEAVLTEVCSFLSHHSVRKFAVKAINELRSDDSIEIVPASSELFERAYTIFAKRTDKDWSLVDCMSFEVMHLRQITQALTTDKHFTQAGFEVLVDLD